MCPALENLSCLPQATLIIFSVACPVVPSAAFCQALGWHCAPLGDLGWSPLGSQFADFETRRMVSGSSYAFPSFSNGCQGLPQGC